MGAVGAKRDERELISGLDLTFTRELLDPFSQLLVPHLLKRDGANASYRGSAHDCVCPACSAAPGRPTPTTQDHEGVYDITNNPTIKTPACKNRQRFGSEAYLGFGRTRSDQFLKSGIHPLGNNVKLGSKSVPGITSWVTAPAGLLPFEAWFKT